MENLSFITVVSFNDEDLKSCIVVNDELLTFVNSCYRQYGEDINIFRSKVSVALNGELIRGSYIGLVESRVLV